MVNARSNACDRRAVIVLNREHHNSFHRIESADSPQRKSSPAGTGPISQFDQISLKNLTKEQAMRAWLARREKDKQADWKIPIHFYGRVVDQDMQPVAGAKISFEWTDLSSTGTSRANSASDQQGNFSLSAVRGKNLGVHVEKEGYYTPNAVRASAFEFADPGERTDYEPDPDHPILFQLRKKQTPAELETRSLELIAPTDGKAVGIDLSKGVASSAGNLHVQTWKPSPPRPMSPAYDWKIALEIPDGGFIETTEEFAFQAPEGGYTPTYRSRHVSESRKKLDGGGGKRAVFHVWPTTEIRFDETPHRRQQSLCFY